MLCVVIQACLTLCDPMDPIRLLCPWIVQARILEWVAMPSSRGSSQPRDWTQVSSIAGGFFPTWTTREAPHDPKNVGNLISDSSASSKPSFHIWKFSVYILLKPSLKDFKHKLAIMWNECNCVIFGTFFGIGLLWDWNENWPFPVLWPLSFPNLLIY